MKQILVTGVSSYIGNAVSKHLREYNAKAGCEMYHVDKVSLRDTSFDRPDWCIPDDGHKFDEELNYDTVLHVAGVAHVDLGEPTEEIRNLYLETNCDLAVKTAKKVKEAGVPQFIYLSSVVIYGDSAPVGCEKHITRTTIPEPVNVYGESKLQAELSLRELESENFHVAALRIPMVYGINCKGNFPVLEYLAERLPIFPNIENHRSMIYIENLAEYIRLLIDSGEGGTFFPQNREYVTTSQMMKAIAEAKGKKIKLVNFLNPFAELACKLPGRPGRMATKAFGSLTVDRELNSNDPGEYQLFSFLEGVKLSVDRD